MFTDRSNINRIKLVSTVVYAVGGGALPTHRLHHADWVRVLYVRCCVAARPRLIGSAIVVHTPACTQLCMCRYANYSIRPRVYASGTRCAVNCSDKHCRAVCAVFAACIYTQCRWYHTTGIIPIVCMNIACSMLSWSMPRHMCIHLGTTVVVQCMFSRVRATRSNVRGARLSVTATICIARAHARSCAAMTARVVRVGIRANTTHMHATNFRVVTHV